MEEPQYEQCPQEAREILGHSGVVDDPNGVYHFENLSVENLRRLIEIGAVDPEDCQNDSPAAAEMLEVGEDNPGTLFSGYRVSDGRRDRRISLETIHIPIKDGMVPVGLLGLVKLADEADEEDGMLRLWWD